MSMRLKKEVHENWHKYHVKGMPYHHRVKKNAIFISSHNTIKHELSKCVGGIMLNKYGDVDFNKDLLVGLESFANLIELSMKDYPKSKSNFITEAASDENPERIIDLVNLNNGEQIEFEINKNILKKDCRSIYL